MPLWGDRLNPGAAAIELNTFIVEKHWHNREIWFGLASAPNGEIHRADEDSGTAFTVDAGNDGYGTALQIIGSADTPVQTGMRKYEPGAIMLGTAENNNQVYFLRVIAGASAAAGVTAGTYATYMLKSAAAAFTGGEQQVRQSRVDSGIKLWAQLFAPGQNTSEITIWIGFHEYER